tara:strand:+ start:3747 stop:4091 length:345 start_codon:yes stop_codon:yes gene_type:complete
MSVKIDKLEKQLVKANERVAELELVIVAITHADETGYVDDVGFVEGWSDVCDETKALLNKFAVEKKIEALRKFEPVSNAVANHWCDKEQKGYLWLHAEILAEIEKLEQLRKEQD